MPRRRSETSNETPLYRHPSDFEECKQWFKILRESGKLGEGKKLLAEQTFDFSSEHELPHHVDTTRRNLQEIANNKHRAVYVLMKSGGFTLDAICGLLRIDEKTLRSHYQKALLIFPNQVQ